MQNAETILSILIQNSKRDKNYVFKRIYRYLFNQDFYIRAYAKIYAKKGNMTSGVDGKTIDGFCVEKIKTMIEKLENERYYPKPVRRIYIPKKNGKMRPLGIPSFEDKLLGEVIRQLLEAIYEPIFSENSHGFRPNRSCHTALMQIKKTARGTSWVIEGDITGCFDNIDHKILLRLLKKKIDDGRFIELIRRFLQAGYFEFRQIHNSMSGCPQGSGMSPILSNIYLNELDKHMTELISRIEKAKQRKISTTYRRLSDKKRYAVHKNNYELAKEYEKQMRMIPAREPMDENFKRVKYVRYADDFVICIIGDKKLALEIKKEVSDFLMSNLKLELNQDKTLITNLKHARANFLGYEFTKSYCNTKLSKNPLGYKIRSINGEIQLLVPSKVINEKIKRYSKNNKPAAYKARINLPVLDIISEFNAEIRGLYNYYSLATDVSKKLYKFKYFHYFSMVKTIAGKEQSSVKKVIKKYAVTVPMKQSTGTRNIVGVTYNTKYGTRTMAYFNDSIKKVNKPLADVSDIFGNNFQTRSQLITRLNASKCELCGSEQNIEVHHVRRLKDIRDKYRKHGKNIPNWVLQMCRINRKTLIVCKKCHDNIHAGNKN